MRTVNIAAAAFVFAVLFAVLPSLDSATMFAAQPPDAGSGYEAWQRHREALKRHAHLKRFYTFENVSATDPTVPSVAGDEEPLTYLGNQPVVRVEGRWPRKTAVRIDEGFYQAKPFDVTDKSFTVGIWFRKHGQGVHLGNGRTNGMLLAQGDGYWSGLRLWSDYPARSIHFEIGRPKPNSSFGLTAPGPLPDGVWHHLAATWDGQEMRLYLNGIPLGKTAYSGEYSAPNGPLRIGFANAGIGSLKLDVDEVAVFNRALPEAEILRHAHFAAPLSAAAEQQFLAAFAAMGKSDWASAQAEFERISQAQDVATEYRYVARMELARCLSRRGNGGAAVSQYAAVFEDPDAPPQVREMALRLCVPGDPAAVRAAASKRVYQRVLSLPGLSSAQQIATRLCLAECCLRDGEPHEAKEQYEQVLKNSDLPPRQAWEIRVKIAHAYLRSKDYQAAREEYEKLAVLSDVPPEYRSNALLCIAHTHIREKDYTKAAAAFAGIVESSGVPAHHREEARQRIDEMKRLARGLSGSDPSAGRVKLPPPPKPAIECFVSTSGNAANPGSKQRPFGSLKQARDAIRRLKASGTLPVGGVAVHVRGGVYPVRETFELTADDSGRADAPIRYLAYEDETPRFSGGVTLDGFKPVTDAGILARLPEEARKKVRCVDLKACGVSDLGRIEPRGYGLTGYPTKPWVDLYLNGRAMWLARWPNDGFLNVGKVHAGRFRSDESGSPGEFDYLGERPRWWKTAEDVWMFGYWGHLWAGRSVKVARLDTERGRVTTAGPSSYGYREGQPYYFFNVLEELDEPGQWYLDRASGVLYLYPPADFEGSLVQFPVFSAPFVVMNNASHVTLAGLVFELGRAEGATISDGTGNLLAGCTFRQLGANGLIVNGGTGHGVLGCDIHTLGAGGIRMIGGDRGTLTPGNHFVENCHIHDFTRIDRVYAPAVHLDGVGNRIAHNLFHDSPHHAMRVEGYEQTVEFNEIHSVVYEADDQAGIDMFGNPAYRGNVIRYNFWHHIGSGHDVAGQSGIRLDDFISRVLVYGNVFYRSAGGRFGGVQIHGGKDNMVDNNLFIDCKYALSFSPWGEKRWLERLSLERTRASVARGGVDIGKPPHSSRYPDLAEMSQNADRNFVWRNVAVNCGDFSARESGKNQLMDNCTFTGEAGFADTLGRDFSLPEDSPIYDRLGFRPIPFHQIGLYQDEHRATWPVEHDVTARYHRED